MIHPRERRFIQVSIDEWIDQLTDESHVGQMPPILRGFYLPQRRDK